MHRQVQIRTGALRTAAKRLVLSGRGNGPTRHTARRKITLIKILFSIKFSYFLLLLLFVEISTKVLHKFLASLKSSLWLLPAYLIRGLTHPTPSIPILLMILKYPCI